MRQHKRTKSTPGQQATALIIVVGLMALGLAVLFHSPNTTTTNKQSAAATQLAAATKQSIVTDLAPKYCASHQQLHLQKLDKLIAQGYPMFDGTGGFTPDQCTTIISKLYDLDSDKAHLDNVVAAKVSVGMRTEEVIFGIGTPNKDNSTNTAAGNSAQWVYGDPLSHALYVYIDNGIVTATQN